MQLITLRLKLVADCNFQHNEADNFNEIIKKHKIDALAPNEVVCLKSLGGAQIVFMYRPREINLEGMGGRRGTAMVYRSVRLRLTRSTWNPMMLQNYAHEVGLELEGLRRFEDALPHLKPPALTGKKDAKVVNISSAQEGSLMSLAEEIQAKAILKAVDFFGALANGELPALPEAFGAEIIAHTMASMIGIPVPDPLPDTAGAKVQAGGMIQELPEAETMLRAHGWKQAPKALAKLIFSAFAINPGSQWSSKQLMARLPIPATTNQVSTLLFKLTSIGLLTRVSVGIYTLRSN